MKHNTLSQTVNQPVHGAIEWWQADNERLADDKAQQKENIMTATIEQTQETTTNHLNTAEPAPSPLPENATTPAAASGSAAGHDLVVGAIWCIGGIIVTAATYSAAKESGGHFIIAWGAILFGGIQFLKGLFNLAD